MLGAEAQVVHSVTEELRIHAFDSFVADFRAIVVRVTVEAFLFSADETAQEGHSFSIVDTQISLVDNTALGMTRAPIGSMLRAALSPCLIAQVVFLRPLEQLFELLACHDGIGCLAPNTAKSEI